MSMYPSPDKMKMSTTGCFPGRYSPSYRAPDQMRRCMGNPSVSTIQILVFIHLQKCALILSNKSKIFLFVELEEKLHLFFSFVFSSFWWALILRWYAKIQQKWDDQSFLCFAINWVHMSPFSISGIFELTSLMSNHLILLLLFASCSPIFSLARQSLFQSPIFPLTGYVSFQRAGRFVLFVALIENVFDTIQKQNGKAKKKMR